MGTIYHNKQIFGGNPLIETIGVGGGFAPIGTIIAYMGTTAPQDYLVCDGSTYNIADYTQLAHFIETQFGSINYFGGDGTTTFAVPDLRGEFLRGSGQNSHADQGNGASVGSHQNATQIPALYGYNNSTAQIGLRYNSDEADGTFNDWQSSDSNKSSSNYAYYTVINGTRSRSTTTKQYKYMTLPTNTSVLYCIKAVVAGDVYSTDERVVGTWIDGKPIYQKTITGTLGTISSSGTTTELATPANITTPLINAWGYCYGNMISSAGTTYIRIFLDNGKITLSTNNTILSNKTYYVTVQYVKTTD